MRKNILALLCLLLSVCVGCGSQVKTETNPVNTEKTTPAAEEKPVETAAQKPSNNPVYVEPKTYEEVLDTVYDIASSTPKRASLDDKYVGVKEIAGHAKTEGIGYCIKDISGDGIPELIIGEIDHKHPDRGSRILLLYTYVDGKAKAVLRGWARSRYYLLDDGLLYHEGSGGARYSFRSIGEISEDGTSVKKREVFKTYIHKNGKEHFGNFHLIYDENGDYTVEEKNEDNESEWHSRSEDMSRTVNLDLIPMSEYKLSHEQSRANEKHAVCGERVAKRYSLAESDGYVYCTRHHELIWYIVEDSLEVDSEDDMLVICADVVTLNENTGKTSICAHKYLYDEENNRMYARGDDGILREIIKRCCWAAYGRAYDIGNMIYYAACGERFIDGKRVYEENQRLWALGRGNSEMFPTDKWFYTDKEGANYYLRQFHKASDWISAQVVQKNAEGKTTDSYLYYVYTYQLQCPYAIYKGTSFASPGEAVERGELYVDSEGTLRSDANPSAVAFFEWFWTKKLGREARR